MSDTMRTGEFLMPHQTRTAEILDRLRDKAETSPHVRVALDAWRSGMPMIDALGEALLMLAQHNEAIEDRFRKALEMLPGPVVLNSEGEPDPP